MRNGLGLPLAPDAPCCRAAAVRFEVSGPAAAAARLIAEGGAVRPAAAGTGWAFAVRFAEPPSPPAVREDVAGWLEAVVELPGGAALRSGAVPLRYVPREKLRHQTEAQRRELEGLRAKRADMEQRRCEAARLGHEAGKALRLLGAAEAAARVQPPRAVLELARAELEQQLERLRSAPAFDPPSALLQLHRGGVGLDNFLQDRRAGRLDPRLAAAVVGLVGELGHAADAWAADAVAATAGDRLQTLVVRTERDVDAVWAMPRYRGLKLMALEGHGRAGPRLTAGGLVDLPRCRSAGRPVRPAAPRAQRRGQGAGAVGCVCGGASLPGPVAAHWRVWGLECPHPTLV